MAPSRIVVKPRWTSVSRSEEREIDTNPSSAQWSSPRRKRNRKTRRARTLEEVAVVALRRGAVPAIMRHDHPMTTSHVAATVPLPPPVARPQDAQLRQDVRWLAATLGRVVGRLAGEDTFRAVEDLRRACRARRLGVPGAPDLDALLARTRSLPPETARLTARAFTVFFILINAAEQAHRVRRSRQDDLAAAQRGSVRWSLRRLH